MPDDVQRGTVRAVARDKLPELLNLSVESCLHPTPELKAMEDSTAAALFLNVLDKSDDTTACVIIPREKQKVPAKTLFNAAVKAIAGFGSLEICIVMKSKSVLGNDRPNDGDYIASLTAMHCTPISRRVFFHHEQTPEGFLLELNETNVLLPIMNGVFEFALPLYAGRRSMVSWTRPGRAVSLERKTCN